MITQYDRPMSTGNRAVSHAGARYRKLFGAFRHPVKAVEAEAAHLHEIEQAGESGETPFIAILGLLLFLLPLFLLLLAIAFGAYYLAS
jgi:hypothetical protein